MNENKIENWLQAHPNIADDLEYVSYLNVEQHSQYKNIEFTINDLKNMLDCYGSKFDFDIEELWSMYFNK